jgi:2-oxoglutarate ferredoxin oxidoreductase subunit alpha
VLSDQEISQRKETCEPVDTSRFTIEDRVVPHKNELSEGYQRFKKTSSGISPISHPGMEGGSYLASGIEHNEAGAPTASGIVHKHMNVKRFEKFAPLKRRDDLFKIYGDPDAPLALVAWGSVAGVAREALGLATEQGLQVKLLVPYLLYPISEICFGRFFAGVQAGLIVEQSHQGQLFRLLRMFLDLPGGVYSYARSGANPFQPSQIVAKLQKQALAFQQITGDRAPQEE